ncbi:DUF805 domain-containing protein [Microbacterium sp. P26]|uniref:DUF805 domain-containing protein n=1 Tax=Microbacterium algihabitans TaxID=3075992 RepID=A0ABU3RZU7_9MICO|nr:MULTISPECIES: DUF805 domain-containing protein [unclassified Microbacterium]MCM3500436.1 DUF805 domain-containing protein [Microbacterium sp. P26]MDU0328401.1 DUF805 domain-containing protein [Microbacterium sp. KSW2-21]
MTTASSAVPLSQPYYGAPIGAAVQRFFKKYATFSGRASRSEFWWWILANAVITFVLSMLALITGGGGGVDAAGNPVPPSGLGLVFLIVLFLWGLATIVPHLALLARRLHDSNRSGFWMFIAFVPLVGGIILLVFELLPSDPQGARFDA